MTFITSKVGGAKCHVVRDGLIVRVFPGCQMYIGEQYQYTYSQLKKMRIAVATYKDINEFI